jgi:hypothetical protein
MLTRTDWIFEKNQVIATWIENCEKSGTSRIAKDTLDRFCHNNCIDVADFVRRLRKKKELWTICNDDHYILSRSRPRLVR